MLEQRSLGWDEAQRAIAAVFEAAAANGTVMSVAVVDNHGDLIACGRMDGSHARVLKHSIRKAYTAAIMGRDTLAFKRDLYERDGNLDEWGDPTLTTLQGGLVVKSDSQVVGGLGVGGSSLRQDEEVARVGLRAMGFSPTNPIPASIPERQGKES